MNSTTQYDLGPDCTLDVTAGTLPGSADPNVGSALTAGPGDIPGQTLGSTDPA
jgi:hypothetical protein